MNFIPSSAWEYKQKDLQPPWSREKKEGFIIGIRPEDVWISPARSDDAIEVSVLLIDPAGSFNWIDVTWDDVKVKGKTEVDADLRSGNRAFMKFSKDKILIFNESTGRREG